MTRTLILAAATVLAGCALPLVSTDYDPGKTHKYARTGTHFPGATDLPRDWKETDVKYMDRDSAEDLVRRQQALPGGG